MGIWQCYANMDVTPVEAYFREHEPLFLRTPEDANRLVEMMLGAESFEYSVAALYALARPHLPSGIVDHEFLVAINAKDGAGGVRFMGDGGTWYSKGEPSKYDEVYYYFMGNDRDFPHDSVIAIDVVRRATKEFLASGGKRPTCVTWQCANDDIPG